MPELIRDHVHRVFRQGTRPAGVAPGACAYMSCRRPAAEHERVFRPGRPRTSASAL